MAEAIPLWCIGKNITSVLFTPQSVNTATGGLTDTTPTAQFFGHLQDVEIESSFTFENLSAMDRDKMNEVPIEQGTILRLTEFEKSAGTNLAALAAFSNKYFKYSMVRGAQTFTGFGVLGSYRMTGTKPRVMAQIELRPIDTGSPNPTYA